MKRTTGRRQWDSTISGASLEKMRKREELSRREVAEQLSELMGRPVGVSDVRPGSKARSQASSSWAT
jgi:hypothetical protein